LAGFHLPEIAPSVTSDEVSQGDRGDVLGLAQPAEAMPEKSTATSAVAFGHLTHVSKHRLGR